jgi:putative transposase
MAQRKHYGAEFKAKVAIEAIAGHKTVNEIASAYGVHPTQVANWKKEVLERLPEVLSNGRFNKDTQAEETIARLYQQIGQLTMEVEYLKKKLGLCR